VEQTPKTTEVSARDSTILQTSLEYARESEKARQKRLAQNAQNWDIYHLNQDFSHKREGQSKEFLAKQAMAVEQITEFFQQGMVDVGDWWRCDYNPGIQPEMMPITRDEIKKLVSWQFDKLDDNQGLLPYVGDSMKSGLLGSVIITKVHGQRKKVPVYTWTQEHQSSQNGVATIKNKIDRGFKTVWNLKLDLLQAFEYGVDPSPAKLYEYHETYLEWHEVLALSEGPDKIYDRSVIDNIGNETEAEWLKKIEKARVTNQPVPIQSRRKIKIQEFWGTIVDLITGEILEENVVWTIANDRFIIQQPKPNPFWHGKSPFVVAPLIRVPGSRWHKSLMDAPTKHNIALNEIYNLILDAGMMATYGLMQYRPEWMEDESSAAEGFVAGQPIAVSSDCPVGAKVVEPVFTSTMSQESLAVYQLTVAEFNQSALTNDLRMGVLPNRAVKATEIVESSNAINSVFTGMNQVLESSWMQRILEMSWEVTLQNADNLDSPEMQSILGRDRALQIASMSPQERYAKCIQGVAFTTYGISKTLSKLKDFKKLTSFLQTVSQSPQLIMEFTAEYSMSKLLEQIMGSLDINTDKLKMTPEEKVQAQMRMQQAMDMQMKLKAGGNTDPGNTAQAATGSSRQTTEGMLPAPPSGNA
jgi:hypothetical protein